MKKNLLQIFLVFIVVLLIILITELGFMIYKYSCSTDVKQENTIQIEHTLPPKVPANEITEDPVKTKQPEVLPVEDEPVSTTLPESTKKVTKNPKKTLKPSPTTKEASILDVSTGYKIAIDAGHQSKGDSNTEAVGPGASTKKARVSSGATGVSSGIPEYQLNLQIALKLQDELISRGYEVYMIRNTNDVSISNMERAIAANESDADICIRIHADGVDNSSVNGASALYPSTSNPYVGYLSNASKSLSNAVLNAYCKETGLRNRGLSIRDDLTGTNWSTIPVTLIELGFLSNPTEDEAMQNTSFQSKMVVGIANGIDQYFNN